MSINMKPKSNNSKISTKIIKTELKQAFNAPALSQNEKLKFIEGLDTNQASNRNSFHFITSQAGYIRKRFWILSLIPLLMAFVSIKIFNINSIFAVENIIQGFPSTFIVFFVSFLLPLLTLLGIGEIAKSASFNMAELELSCKHNLSEIVLARLAIVSSFHLVLIIALISILIGEIDCNIFQTILYLVVPFMLNTYLSLFVSNHIKSRETLPICAGITGFLCLSYSIVSTNLQFIFNSEYLGFWITAFIGITILIFTELQRLITNSKQLILG